MGRRKERRLAAKAASGRRVKLDLFLDASPGDASSKEGVGGENREQQSGVPTSPSSSGGFNQFPSKGYVKKTCLCPMECKLWWKFGTFVSMYMLHISGFEADIGFPACKEH